VGLIQLAALERLQHRNAVDAGGRRRAGKFGKCRQHVLEGDDLVACSVSGNRTGPAGDKGHTDAAFG